MNKLILLVFLFGILSQAEGSSSTCREYQAIKTQHSSEKIDKFVMCIRELIEKQSIQELLEIQKNIPETYQHLYLQALDNEIKTLESIEDHIITTKSSCRPILQWAQNQTHIFIAAKLSHRWDSPPCLKTVSENYSLTNNTLSFQNVCLMNKVSINFSFHEELYNQTIKSLNIKKDGVGTFSMIIQKQNEAIWPSPFKTGEGISLWDQMMDKGNGTRAKYLSVREAYQKDLSKSSLSDL